MDMVVGTVKIPKNDVLKYVRLKTTPEDLTKPYFDLKEFPVCEKGFNGPGFEKLAAAFGKEAIRNGFTLIKSGFPKRKGITCQHFKCNRALLYRGDIT